MNAWLEIGLSNAVVATALAALVWCLTRIVRRPKFAFVLWSLVLVKLLVPGVGAGWTTYRMTIPRSEPALVSQVADEPATQMPVAASKMAPIVRKDSVEPAAMPQATDAVAERINPVETKQLAETPPSEPWDISWTSLVGIAWLAGSVLWLLVAVFRLLRFQRLLARAPLAGEALTAEVAGLCRRLKIKTIPTVRVTIAAVTPLVWSTLGRSTVLLPQVLVDRLDDDERTTLIAHELAHVARHDGWVRWLELAAVGVYWWHPVAWWARRNVARAGELCCDATVVDLLPEMAHAYARTLLAAVEFCGGARSALPAGSSGFSQASTLKRRMEMILAHRQTQRLGWPLRLAMVGLAAVVLPASIGAVAAPPDSSPAAAKAASSAAKPGRSVEERLDRLEKMIEALTREVRAMRSAEIANAEPAVIKTVPENGAEDVDPNLAEIRVTFNKDMQDGTWSWTQRSDDTFPEVTGKIHYLDDHRTCVLPVKLQPGKTYYLSINSARFRNFQDTSRRPAVPYPIAFKTKGAAE